MPSFFNTVENNIKEGLSKGLKGDGNFINTVANKGKDIIGNIGKIPVLGDLINNSPVVMVANKVLDMAGQGGNLLSDVGHREFKNAVYKGIGMASTVFPARKLLGEVKGQLQPSIPLGQRQTQLMDKFDTKIKPRIGNIRKPIG